MKNVLMVVGFVLIGMTYGCMSSQEEGSMKSGADNSNKGAELSVLCLGTVEETLYVDVLSGSYKESFGEIGAGPNNREGGKTVGFGAMEITSGVTVRWGIDGKDGLKMEHRAQFDLLNVGNQMKVVKAIVLYYSGNGKWELRAYNKNISADDKKLLFSVHPKS